jgi:ATP/maltotriose-dependent transcriptional regulator MalT
MTAGSITPPACAASELQQAAQASYNGAHTLTEALTHAYYQRDIDAIRRIAAQVEWRLAVLSHLRETAR